MSELLIELLQSKRIFGKLGNELLRRRDYGDP